MAMDILAIQSAASRRGYGIFALPRDESFLENGALFVHSSVRVYNNDNYNHRNDDDNEEDDDNDVVDSKVFQSDLK